MAGTENFVIVEKKQFVKLEQAIAKATVAVQKTALAAQQELATLQAHFVQLSQQAGVAPKVKKTRAKKTPTEAPAQEPGDFDDKQGPQEPAPAPVAEEPKKAPTRKAPPAAAKVVQLPKQPAKQTAAKVAPAMPGRR